MKNKFRMRGGFVFVLRITGMKQFKNNTMKSIFSIAAMTATLLTSQGDVKAQMPYNVTTANETYVPLTNATVLNSNLLWSDTCNFTIPLGFNFRIGDNTINSLVFSQSNLILPALSGTQSGFAMLGTSLQDRNFPDGPSAVSPVQYTVTGAAGNRVLKLELKNAGFNNEKEMFGTTNDFVNIQIWFQEQNNSIAFHFGPSTITHFNDYFNEKMPLGFIKGLNMEMFTFQKFYCLKGNPMAPGMDSLNNLNTPSGFDTYPASGTLYRFIPKTGTTAVRDVNKIKLGKIYPIPANDVLYIESAATDYTISNLTGHQIMSGKIRNVHEQISLQSFSPGMYMITLRNNKNETEVQKFVKQ